MNWRIFAALGTLFSSMLLASGEKPGRDVAVGEVVSQTDDSVTLNVHPCGKKELHTISPYRQVSSEDATCSDGKKYIRVTVEQTGDDTKDAGKEPHDKKKDKSKSTDDGDKDTPNPPN